MLQRIPKYSGTPPYDHPVYKTTSLLRPYSFKPNIKNIDSFYYFEDPVNATTSLLRPGFYGPKVVALTGFHCRDYYREKYFGLKFSGNVRVRFKTLNKCNVLTLSLHNRCCFFPASRVSGDPPSLSACLRSTEKREKITLIFVV